MPWTLTIPQLLSTESDNEITLTAFRLLTMDLLVLFSVMNEGTINVLGTSLVLVQESFSDIARTLFRDVKNRCRASLGNLQNLQ